MEINVSQLLKQPIGATRIFRVDEDVEGITESGQWTRVKGEVKLLRTRAGILVRALLDTAVECDCSRCLEAVGCELALEIEEEYFPTIDVNTGYTVEVPKDSTGFIIDSNHILSLDEAIRQYVLLNQPMQPLCRPDCAGLCPECGVNLNLEQCECHLKPSVNPFAGLGKLLDADDDLAATNERS